MREDNKVNLLNQEDQLRNQLAFANGCIDELKNQVNKLKAYNESQDRFWQAFCAALNGLISSASPPAIDAASIDLFNQQAIKYAQEAVRQVGELNKPKCKHEKGWEGAEGGPVYCILCDEKRELANIHEEQARDS